MSHPQVAELRETGTPTVPTKMSVERETNPFLRWDSPELRKVRSMTCVKFLIIALTVMDVFSLAVVLDMLVLAVEPLSE